MSAWVIAPHGATEPCLAPEFSIDGIAGIEIVGNDVRVYCYSEQAPLESLDSEQQRVVVVKLRGSIKNVPTVIGQLAQCLLPGGKTFTPEGPKGPRLVT